MSQQHMMSQQYKMARMVWTTPVLDCSCDHHHDCMDRRCVLSNTQILPSSLWRETSWVADRNISVKKGLPLTEPFTSTPPPPKKGHNKRWSEVSTKQYIHNYCTYDAAMVSTRETKDHHWSLWLLGCTAQRQTSSGLCVNTKTLYPPPFHLDHGSALWRH